MRVKTACGCEWLVDAHGCDAGKLRSPKRIQSLYARLRRDLRLNPAAAPAVYRFPDPGGLTFLVLLKESHFAAHTFPEHGSMCLNLFCCRPRPEWDFVGYLKKEFGAGRVRVRRIERPYDQT